MIKIENTEVLGWEAAIRGMRNPMNSWEKSDSVFIPSQFCDAGEDFELAQRCGGVAPIIKKNDLQLMQNLCKAGSDHSKFMRMINVTCDITCHHAWWAEYDTYKIGTVRNSCSKMHKIHVKEFVPDDFSHEGIDEVGDFAKETFNLVISALETLRVLFNETHEKKYWRAIIELLPMGYNIKATVQLNYQVLKAFDSREGHKLDEWSELLKWRNKLPYFAEITGSK